MSKAQCTTPESFGHASLDIRSSGGPMGVPGGGFVQRLVGLPFAALEALLVWQERVSERRHLLELDGHLLKDMGLSRADAEREASVPFWRAG